MKIKPLREHTLIKRDIIPKFKYRTAWENLEKMSQFSKSPYCDRLSYKRAMNRAVPGEDLKELNKLAVRISASPLRSGFKAGGIGDSAAGKIKMAEYIVTEPLGPGMGLKSTRAGKITAESEILSPPACFMNFSGWRNRLVLADHGWN